MNTAFLIVLAASSEPVIDPPVVDPPNWSLGGGIAIDAYNSDARPIGLGVQQLDNGPRVRTLFSAERRLVRGLWLMLEANVAFETIGAAVGASSLHAGGALGLRYQVDLPWRVELSPFVRLAGEYESRYNDFAYSVQQTDGSWQSFSYQTRQVGGSFAARVGLMLERELVSGLALRLSTTLAELKVTQTKYTSYDYLTESESAATNIARIRVAVAIEPALELRYRF